MSKIPHPAKAFKPFAADAHRAFATSLARPDLRSALVFPDTNVLLAPYRGSSETLQAIRKTYEILRSAKRIIVPAQVAREFARNRLNLLADVHKYVRDAKSLSFSGHFAPPPILSGTTECEEAKKQLEGAAIALKAYRAALDQLAEKIGGWQTHDPVLEMYEKLFDSTVVRELTISADALEEIRRTRFDARVPPGYRDRGKDDDGVGDLAIWLTILETASSAKQDAIFVTEEAKTDWFHKSSDQKIFLRYELLEEFGSYTAGKSFCVMSLAELLKAHGASAKVLKEVRESALSETTFGGTGLQAQDVEVADTASLRQSLVRELASCVRAAGGMVTFGETDNDPDIYVTVDEDRLGVSAAPTAQPADNIYTFTRRRLERAAAIRQRQKLLEHVVVFASPLLATVQALDHWFAEDNYQGPGLAAVVVMLDRAGLRVVKNQASHPVFRVAFAT